MLSAFLWRTFLYMYMYFMHTSISMLYCRIVRCPTTAGSHSWYTIFCQMAASNFRLSWNSLSSSQCGFTAAKPEAMLLCARTNSVCIPDSAGISSTRGSPGSLNAFLLTPITYNGTMSYLYKRQRD